MSILLYHPRAEAYRALLTAECPDVPADEIVAVTPPAPPEPHLDTAEVLLTFQVPLEALRRAARLRWLQLTSAGADHLLPAREALRSVIVTNSRGIHADLMADYVLGVVLMLRWDFPRLLRQQQGRQWRHQYTAPLAGQTLGVVGVGAVGREIARRAVAARMTVLGMRRRPEPIEGVSRMFGPDQLSEMLPACDVVVLVVPATDATRGLVGARELRAMRPTAHLVNVARGSVVDERALTQALREGWIAGAALDVFAREPLPPESPLWGMENVIVTPHIAGEPADYPRRVMTIFAENLRRWRAGRPLLNVVDLDRGY